MVDTEKIASKNSTTIKAKPAARVRFERAPVTADIVALGCTNPYCPCKTVTLYFINTNAQSAIPMFEIVVNYETWQMESSKIHVHDMDYAELIAEFMSVADKRLIDDIRSGVMPKARTEHKLRDGIDLSVTSNGGMVYYTEIYCTEPYEDLIIELNGTEYYVLDYYCPKPSCDCTDVILSFYKVEGNAVRSEPILGYKVNFATGKCEIVNKSPEVTMLLVKELYSKLLKSVNASSTNFFENRYMKIKEWGASQFMVERTSTKATVQKTGRNEPCPCGSGKKYKKCCGFNDVLGEQ